jgi:hypothetical protein
MIREQLTGNNLETILLLAKGKFPDDQPWLMSDNRSRFVARDFKEPFNLHSRKSPC